MKLLRLVVPLTISIAALVACTRKADSPPVPKASAAVHAGATVDPAIDPIAWRRGDVDAAFAEAKASNKPVFLYWGAGWCPPCNQMKATLFNKREFVERTEYFIPVYVDGDTPAAQKLGTRFSVSGYPTMVLFKPDGTEITRLPGEADPERYLQLLTIGLNSARPVRETLESALGDGTGLTQDDWRMLAWYSWDTDDQQLLPTARVPAALQRLAARCPAGFAETRTRLVLKAAAAEGAEAPGPASGKNTAAPSAIARAAALAQVEAVLATPRSARENFDLLTGALPEIVSATSRAGSPERKRLLAEADRSLAQLAADTGLSNTDRLGATITRVQLTTIDADISKAAGPPEPVVLPDGLVERIRAEVARVDRESKDPYERQTVIHAAAYLLTAAGRVDDSDALLEAELSRSHSAYYFMLGLASNAKKRGDKAAAIGWYAKAYDAAKGPATRLQWGATYLDALIQLSPDDAIRIATVADQIIREVEPIPASFDGRNRKSLSRMSNGITAWNAAGRHDAEATRIGLAARSLCERVPADAPERLRCRDLLKVEAPPAVLRSG